MSFFTKAFRPVTARSATLAATSVARPAATAFPGQSLRFLSQDVRSTIDKAVKANPVVLFMKGTPNVPQCGFSRAVVQLLDINGVEPATLKTYNVLEDQELRDAIKEYSSWPTIPQLYVNGEFVGGCDILLGMHQSGELSQLLTKEGVVAKGEEASS